MTTTTAPPTGEQSVIVTPRDPIIVRDGRPFAALPGARAVSLPWPLPSTVAGLVRTSIGTHATPPFDWQGDGPTRACRISVHGPLLLARHRNEVPWGVYLPAPRDALVLRAPDEASLVHVRRPNEQLPDGAGSNLPPGLLPLYLPTGTASKPVGGYTYWPLEAATRWLADATPAPQAPPAAALGEAHTETRVHVALDSTTGTARQGFLFSTEARVFAAHAAPNRRAHADDGDSAPDRRGSARALLLRVATDERWAIDTPRFATLGGERRLVTLNAGNEAPSWPTCPAFLSDALGTAHRLRLILVTPALFSAGWKPGWLSDGPHGLDGSPPGLPTLHLRLVAAIVGRPDPVSGWDMATHKPKALHYLAPAGSVYFFELLGPPLTSAQAEALWLTPLSDREQDRTDGFGLVIPGVW